MRKRNELFTRLVGLMIIIFVVINFIPTPYMVLAPGIAEDLSQIITVEDGYKGLIKGNFMLTAVTSHQATVWDLFYLTIRKPAGIELEDMASQIPPGMNMNEYMEIMNRYMVDSQLKAQKIAFEKAGYDVEMKGKGARIDQVLEVSSATGKLKKGDLIINIDGQPIRTDQEAVEQIRKHSIGETVVISVKRDEQELQYNLETIETEGNPGKASIGIMIFTEYEYYFPRDVSFETKNIAGPSAGVMFTMEIYNQLIPEDITEGRKIAGTGTIELDGSLGRIDGIKQKVLAAEKNRAEIFILPVENYEEARGTEGEITLAPVDNIDQVIKFLKGEYNPMIKIENKNNEERSEAINGKEE